MKKALVFCGGGSLGSYEVGAWRYLKEKGYHYDIVTGTSIGAINGAMYAINAYDECVKLWEEVTLNKVMSEGFNLSDNVLDNIRSLKSENLKSLVKTYLKLGGVDISPFKELVKKVIDPKKIKASKVLLGIVTTELKTRKEVDVILNEQNEEDILPFLHASSACWPIFPMETIHDKKYIDGGYLNNLPIDFALRLGADEITAVMLRSIPKEPQHPELMRAFNVTTIRPSRDTGTILYFESNTLKNNMELGYLDAKKTFGEALGFSYCFEKDKKFENIAKEVYRNCLREHLYQIEKIISSLFSKDMPKPKNEMDLLIRSLELLANPLEIDPYKVWKIQDMINTIISTIKKNAPSKIIDEQSLKTKRMRNAAIKKEKIDFLKHLYISIKNKKNPRSWANKYFSSFPETAYFISLFEVLLK